LAFLLTSILSLAGCANVNGPAVQGTASSVSATISDAIPQWAGGMPKDVPPRRGTPEYDAWQAERAKEAARDKTVKKQ